MAFLVLAHISVVTQSPRGDFEVALVTIVPFSRSLLLERLIEYSRMSSRFANEFSALVSRWPRADRAQAHDAGSSSSLAYFARGASHSALSRPSDFGSGEIFALAGSLERRFHPILSR